MKPIHTLISTFLLIQVSHLYGQQNDAIQEEHHKSGIIKPLDPFRVYLGIEMGITSVSQEASRQHNIGNAGFNFGFETGMLIFEVIDLYAGVGGSFPKDEASFTQQVQPLLGGGSVSDAESSLELTRWSFAVGPRTPYLKLGQSKNGKLAGISLLTRFGRASISGKRFISDCKDCRDEKLKLNNGSFFDLGLDFAFYKENRNSRLHLTSVYRKYSGNASLKNEFNVAVLFSFL